MNRFYTTVIACFGTILLAPVSRADLVSVDIQYADTEAVYTAAKEMLSASSKLTLYQNRILFNGTEEDLSILQSLVAELDRPPKSLTISISTSAAAHSIEGSRIGTSHLSKLNQLQSIRTLEGKESIIYSANAKIFIRSSGLFTKDNTLVEAKTGFAISARAADQVATMTVRQFDERWESPRELNRQVAESTLQIPFNKWVLLGELQQDRIKLLKGDITKSRSHTTYGISKGKKIYIKIEKLD